MQLSGSNEEKIKSVDIHFILHGPDLDISNLIIHA